MANWRLKELRGRERRRFLKLMGMAGAAYGLHQSKVLNFIADEGGSGLAEAAGNSARRAIGVTGGNGSFAWFQELWPVPSVAEAALTNTQFGGSSSYLYTPQYAYNGAPGTMLTHASGKRFYYSPDAPWFDHTTGTSLRPMSAYIAGNDETHTEFPESAAIVSGNASLAAAIGSIQAKDSSAIVPVIGIDPLKYGVAPGAPDVTTAPSAEGIVDLFNSAASQFVLADETNQELFDTYYNALLKLRRASDRSSWQPQIAITRNAAKLIGLNFAAALTPTAEDLALYGVSDIPNSVMNAAQMAGMDAFGRTLITVARAFKLGLSNSAIVGLSPGPTSEQSFTDPHVTFNNVANMDRGRAVTQSLGRILDAFYEDLATVQDPASPSERLDETTVFFAWGDTPHTPLQGSNWPDATPNDCNWIYCMGLGKLNEGWYGDVYMNGMVDGWNPTTGDNVPGQPATNTSTAAAAAVTYAVARGNMNTVAEYYVGPEITGVVNS